MGWPLEVRLGDAARLTKGVDLGLRDEVLDAADLRDRLIETLGDDADADGFTFSVAPAQRMAEDGGGHLTWRVAVTAALAGRQFGAVKLDVSPRAHELEATEIVTLPNSLAFAGLGTVQIEIVDVHRHAAEKLHAMSRDYGDRENSRVRDLADLMLLRGHELLRAPALADAGLCGPSARARRRPTPGPSGPWAAGGPGPRRGTRLSHAVSPVCLSAGKAGHELQEQPRRPGRARSPGAGGRPAG